jgi:hypothetical protein
MSRIWCSPGPVHMGTRTVRSDRDKSRGRLHGGEVYRRDYRGVSDRCPEPVIRRDAKAWKRQVDAASLNLFAPTTYFSILILKR